MTTVEPNGIGTQNLGSMFGTRTAGAGKLPPRPGTRRQETVVDVRESPAEPKEAAKQAAAAPGAEARTEEPSKPARTPRTPKADTTAPDKKQIIVYLPVDLADRLRAAGEETGRTHLQLVTDALEATHERLDDLLAAVGYVESSQSSGLFGKATRPVSRRPGRRGTAQISLRPSAEVRTVMDRLVEKHSAPNRSALIEVALDAHLSPVATG
jgi:predicted DNA-binding protein